MSAIPQAITPNPHTNLLNVYIQIANTMRFQPKKKLNAYPLPLMFIEPLPNNGRLFWLHFSSFQESFHSSFESLHQHVQVM
jgi:hypothetical protein